MVLFKQIAKGFLQQFLHRHLPVNRELAQLPGHLGLEMADDGFLPLAAFRALSAAF